MSFEMLLFIFISLSFVFIIGTCVGSFLNVVILRAFSEESICFPGSKCPACQKPLKWYHNIPILSYFILRGKCAFCEEKISPQYPIIEFITGLLFVLVFLKFGLALNTIFMLTFVSFFVVIAATDIKEKVIFDRHLYTLAGIGLIYNFFNVGNLYHGDKVFHIANFSFSLNNSFLAAIVGMVIGVIIMEAFARVGYIMAGERAFGEGDSYIAAALGSIFGLQYLLTVIVYSFLIQIFLTVPIYIKKLFSKKDYTTILTFLAFFGMIIILKCMDPAFISANFHFYWILSVVLCAIGVFLCFRILRGIKDKNNTMTYLPFGPAMVAAALILIFIN